MRATLTMTRGKIETTIFHFLYFLSYIISNILSVILLMIKMSDTIGIRIKNTITRLEIISVGFKELYKTIDKIDMPKESRRDILYNVKVLDIDIGNLYESIKELNEEYIKTHKSD